MKVETIKLDKGANIFPVGPQNFHCKTVKATVAALAGCDLSESVFIFAVDHAPCEKRAMNAFVKRCRKIADGCGVSLTDPVGRVEQGFAFDDQFVMRVEA